MGYTLPERKLPNPIDIVLVYAQQVVKHAFLCVSKCGGVIRVLATSIIVSMFFKCLRCQ